MVRNAYKLLYYWEIDAGKIRKVDGTVSELKSRFCLEHERLYILC